MNVPTVSALAPLSGYPWLVRLSETEDVVTLPLGATQTRPVIVAVHGADDRPDWACGGWRLGVEAYGFVVCPTGLPMGHSRYGWGSGPDIGNAVERVLGETRQWFPEYLASGPMIYAGFSQGAILASAYLIANAGRFPIVALAEGGYDYLSNAEFARKFHAAGGKRAVLLCGTPGCMVSAHRADVVLTRAGLEVVVAGDVKAGHNLNVRMQDAIRLTPRDLALDRRATGRGATAVRRSFVVTSNRPKGLGFAPDVTTHRGEHRSPLGAYNRSRTWPAL
jgi:hypothetical protein